MGRPSLGAASSLPNGVSCQWRAAGSRELITEGLVRMRVGEGDGSHACLVFVLLLDLDSR